MKSLLTQRILTAWAMILPFAGLSFAAPQAERILFTTGSAPFTVDQLATTARYTQSTESLSFGPGVALGDTIGGLIRPAAAADLSTARLAVIMKSNGPSLSLPFTIELFKMETPPRLLATYTGSISGVDGTSTLVALQPVAVLSSGATEIDGIQFTWDGAAAANIEVLGLAVLAGPTAPAPTPDQPWTAQPEAVPPGTPAITAPTLEVTSPGATRKNTYRLRISVAEGKSPSQVLYRLRAPGSRKFSGWQRIPLSPTAATIEEVSRPLRLNKRGIWRVQVLLQDANKTTLARTAVPIRRR